MAYILVDETLQTPEGPVRRVVEERTRSIHILTPLTDRGPRDYTVVAYRELVETRNGVRVSITPLPPMPIQLTQQLAPFMSAIATRVDLVSQQLRREQRWPPRS